MEAERLLLAEEAEEAEVERLLPAEGVEEGVAVAEVVH